jgi:hypothetical protein
VEFHEAENGELERRDDTVGARSTAFERRRSRVAGEQASICLRSPTS